MDVAIVIPALDEELSLPGVLADVPAEFAARVVVVDNGSRDRTAQVARDAGAEVVREPRRGYGAACLAGLAHLAARPPDVVAFLDADHSNDPRELPALFAPLAAGADLAIGSRVLGRREEGSLTSLQVFGNALAAGLMRVAFGARVTDLGPFRAIRWPALQRLGMRDRDYGWTVEMQARAFREGLSVAEVPVRTWRRRVGSSKVSGTLRGAFGAGTKILFTIARVRLGG
jgi:glycosyltransferase involved in cell wall biosynthesis